MVELMGELEFPAQTGELGLVPVLLVEHFQRDRAVGSCRVVGSINRRVPAMADGGFNDVALKPITGRKHPPRLGRTTGVGGVATGSGGAGESTHRVGKHGRGRGQRPRDGGVGLYVPVSSMISKMVWAVRWRRCRSGQRMWFSCGACVEAVGSGMNGARSKVQRRWLIHGWATVVMEHRDRLGRMNTELVQTAVSAHGRRLVVLDAGAVTDDLVREWPGCSPRLSAACTGAGGSVTA